MEQDLGAPLWDYELFPVPRWRIAQALDLYARAIADPAERQALQTHPLFRRYQRFGAPPAPDARAARRVSAAAALLVEGSPDAWSELAELDDLLISEEHAVAWRGEAGEAGEAEEIVRGHVRKIAPGLDAETVALLARFAITAEGDERKPEDGVDFWRETIEEGILVYLSLLASGVPVPDRPAEPEHDEDNEFPAHLTDALAWAEVRLWKFRPSPHLARRFARSDHSPVDRYILAAQRLSQAIGRRLAAESPGVTTADPALYARLLGRWGNWWSWDRREAAAWPDLATEAGGPLDGIDRMIEDPRASAAVEREMYLDGPVTVTGWADLAAVLERGLAMWRRDGLPGILLDGRVEARFGQPDSVTVSGPVAGDTAGILGFRAGTDGFTTISPDGSDRWLAWTAVEAARLLAGLDVATVAVDWAPGPPVVPPAGEAPRDHPPISGDDTAVLRELLGDLSGHLTAATRLLAAAFDRLASLEDAPPAEAWKEPVEEETGEGEEEEAPVEEFTFRRTQGGAVHRLVNQLSGADVRVVRLEDTSLASLRHWLPPWVRVQPESGEADLIVIYRSTGAPVGPAETRHSYRFVDRIAGHSWPSSRIGAATLRCFERLLPDLQFVPEAAREQVLARARWRRAAPAGDRDPDDGVSTADAANLDRLARLLVDLTHGDEAPDDREVCSVLLAREEMAELTRAELVAHAVDRPSEPVGDVPEVEGDGLPGPLRELVAVLAGDEQHDLRQVRDVAVGLGLYPLGAFVQINEWAAERLEAEGRNLEVPLLEVDETANAIFVDPALRELFG